MTDHNTEHPITPEEREPAAGRSLDALIHTLVMGQCAHAWNSGVPVNPKEPGGCRNHTCTLCGAREHVCVIMPDEVPGYSGSIGEAWKVVEEMRRRGFTVELESNEDEPLWQAQFWLGSQCRGGRGATAAAAICAAALAAIRGAREPAESTGGAKP